MSADDIFDRTKDAYLCLIHPIRDAGAYRQDLAPILTLAPSVPDALVTAMITGVSWRERLLGLCMAMAQQPTTFVGAMFQSLSDPRGIAMVPTCAALAVLARKGVFPMTKSFGETFDRASFDGELGWAIEKAKYVAGLRADDVPGNGPNYGQIFGDHVEVYSWLNAA